MKIDGKPIPIHEKKKKLVPLLLKCRNKSKYIHMYMPMCMYVFVYLDFILSVTSN